MRRKTVVRTTFFSNASPPSPSPLTAPPPLVSVPPPPSLPMPPLATASGRGLGSPCALRWRHVRHQASRSFSLCLSVFLKPRSQGLRQRIETRGPSMALSSLLSRSPPPTPPEATAPAALAAFTPLLGLGVAALVWRLWHKPALISGEGGWVLITGCDSGFGQGLARAHCRAFHRLASPLWRRATPRKVQ